MMTVKQLIEALEQMPQDATVVVFDTDAMRYHTVKTLIRRKIKEIDEETMCVEIEF